MLLKRDFHYNFCILSLGCKLAALPLDVDVTKGELKLARGFWKGVICRFTYALYALHVAYIVLRLLYLLHSGAHIPLLSLLWHLTLCIATPSLVFWHYTAFFRWPDISVTCFNKAFETWEAELAAGMHFWDVNLSFLHD